MRRFRVPRAGIMLARWSSGAGAAEFAGPQVAGFPIEFMLFACVLAGVALFHAHVLPIAAAGAVVIALYKTALSPFKTGSGLAGFAGHLEHEWVILLNLL